MANAKSRRLRSTARWLTVSLVALLLAVVLAVARVVPMGLIWILSSMTTLFIVRFYFMVRAMDDDDWRSLK